MTAESVTALGRDTECLALAHAVRWHVRHGTTNLFAAFNIADGTVISELHRRHRAAEYLKFLRSIDKAVPPELDVHIACDNLSAHKTPAVNEWISRRPRFHVHVTPTGSSWVNQVERWFAYLTTQKLQRSAHKSVQSLEAGIRDWIAQWNQAPKPFVWKKTAEEILDSPARYLQRISGGEHRRRSCSPAPCITPACRSCRSGGGSCLRRARSSREGRHKRAAVTHAVLSGLEERAGIRLRHGPP